MTYYLYPPQHRTLLSLFARKAAREYLAKPKGPYVVPPKRGEAPPLRLVYSASPSEPMTQKESEK